MTFKSSAQRKYVMSQLSIGRKVEKEHKATINKIKSGKIKTNEQIYTSIAKDHLKEDKDYYTKLKKAKL
jgi:hypothetical protein